MFAWELAGSWTRMFLLDQEVTLIEKIARPFIVYGALIVLLRLFGKRELAQLNPFDLVVLLSLSNTVQNAIIGADNSLTGGLVGAVALLTVNYLVALVKYFHPAIERLLEGSPVTLIQDGRPNPQATRQELLTQEDLEVIAHREGFRDLAHVENCVLDPNGSFLIEGKNHEERQRDEILARLESLQREMADLRATLVKS